MKKQGDSERRNKFKKWPNLSSSASCEIDDGGQSALRAQAFVRQSWRAETIRNVLTTAWRCPAVGRDIHVVGGARSLRAAHL